MTDEEFADFASEMRVLVAEESQLWELPLGSTDHLRDGESRRHGPWRQEDCAAAVKVWLEAGLVSLVPAYPDSELLSASAAREALDAPLTWVIPSDGSRSLCLLSTDAGDAVTWDDWIALLDGLRRR